MPKRFVTREQIRLFLCCSHRQVDNLAAAGALGPVTHKNGRVLLDVANIEAFAGRCWTNPPSPDEGEIVKLNIDEIARLEARIRQECHEQWEAWLNDPRLQALFPDGPHQFDPAPQPVRIITKEITDDFA